MALFNTAHERFVSRNAKWIAQLFYRYDSIVASLQAPAQGHTYTFKNVELNTVLRQAIGKKCGDNGGRTKQKLPCKRDGQIHGRCGDHPTPFATVATVFEQHALVPKLTVLVCPNDESVRPLPAVLRWDQVVVYTPDHAALMVPALGTETFAHVPMSIIWNEVIMELKNILCLPPELVIYYRDQVLGVDPLWSVDHFYATYHISEPVSYNEIILQPGYLLADYHLLPNAQLV